MTHDTDNNAIYDTASMEKYIHLEFQPLLFAVVFNLCVPTSHLANLLEHGFLGPTPRDSDLVDLR